MMPRRYLLDTLPLSTCVHLDTTGHSSRWTAGHTPYGCPPAVLSTCLVGRDDAPGGSKACMASIGDSPRVTRAISLGRGVSGGSAPPCFWPILTFATLKIGLPRSHRARPFELLTRRAHARGGSHHPEGEGRHRRHGQLEGHVSRVQPGTATMRLVTKGEGTSDLPRSCRRDSAGGLFCASQKSKNPPIREEIHTCQ
jgi:hypothetical protein